MKMVEKTYLDGQVMYLSPDQLRNCRKIFAVNQVINCNKLQ